MSAALRNDLTVIYYTANHEKPVFERNIQKILMESSGGIPIISVSHQPMEFGHNICVGDVGRSELNIYRQMMIGVEAAKTRFVCTAESDMLYPEEYFKFIPEREDVAYRAMPVYVLFAQRGRAKYFAVKPRGTEAAMVVGRDCLVRALDRMMHGLPQWDATDIYADPVRYLISFMSKGHFNLSIPVVTIKTDHNLHRKTPHVQGSLTRELEGWGHSRALLDRLYQADTA